MTVADYSLDDALAEHLLAVAAHAEPSAFPVAVNERTVQPGVPHARQVEEAASRAPESAMTLAATGNGPARWSDPAESWNGAPTQTDKQRVRLWVLGAVHRHGPISDEDLLELALREGVVKRHTSSVRSRRNDLTREGLVVLADKNGRSAGPRNNAVARWSTTTSEATG